MGFSARKSWSDSSKRRQAAGGQTEAKVYFSPRYMQLDQKTEESDHLITLVIFLPLAASSQERLAFLSIRHAYVHAIRHANRIGASEACEVQPLIE